MTNQTKGCLGILDLLSRADAARRQRSRAAFDAALLPALDRNGPRAICAYYVLGEAPGTWVFVDEAAMIVEPRSGALLAGPIHLHDISPRMPPEGAVMKSSRPEIEPREFLESYFVVLRLQPRVWDAFLATNGDAVASRSAIERYARAWRAVIRPDLRGYYELLSPEFEAWLETFAS